MKLDLSVSNLKVAVILSFSTLAITMFGMRSQHTKNDLLKTASSSVEVYTGNYSHFTNQNEITDNENTKANECSPPRSIVFLKTHKTGGTSLKRILLNHASRLGLKDVIDSLPAPFCGGYPGRFRARYARHPNSPLLADAVETKTKMNGLFCHFRLDIDEVKSIMLENTKYITIIRNPFHQFESAFQFFYGRLEAGHKRKVELSCSGCPYYQAFKAYKGKYPDYLRIVNNTWMNDSVAWFFRSRNSQSFDLGFDPRNEGESYIHDHIRQLDSFFDLVMITDHYLQSLVLLKDVLCMEWEDILLRARNVGEYVPHKLTPKEENVIRSLNKQDFPMFDYFNQTFWRKVDAYGRDRMEKDVEYLRKLIKENHPNGIKLMDAKKILKAKENGMTPMNAKRILNRIEKKSKMRKATELNKRIPVRNREYLINQIMDRIEMRTTTSLNRITENEMAEYMFENAGWCPY